MNTVKLIRDVDYFIFIEDDFPTDKVCGVIVANSDQTANIYINNRCSNQQQAETIKHELRHLIKGHLWDESKTTEQKELEAQIDDPAIVFGENFSFIAYTGRS